MLANQSATLWRAPPRCRRRRCHSQGPPSGSGPEGSGPPLQCPGSGTAPPPGCSALCSRLPTGEPPAGPKRFHQKPAEPNIRTIIRLLEELQMMMILAVASRGRAARVGH